VGALIPNRVAEFVNLDAGLDQRFEPNGLDGERRLAMSNNYRIELALCSSIRHANILNLLAAEFRTHVFRFARQQNSFCSKFRQLGLLEQHSGAVKKN